jgi:hypothetical protein
MQDTLAPFPVDGAWWLFNRIKQYAKRDRNLKDFNFQKNEK